mmetsp:Transcript_19187/g.53720  ORF Transcript_19187/g.53720 Transcript_19187/m.53720 type:complete len:216 (-) Transcript_19187:280-927(-)
MMCHTAMCTAAIAAMPVEPLIKKTIIIWYRLASDGSAPARIWPVIMPGMDTSPMTAIMFTVGIMALVRAFWTTDFVASARLAPRASSSSICSLEDARSCKAVLRPTDTPEVALPSSMPSTGMIDCASHKGLSCSTTRAAYMMSSQAPMLRASSVCRYCPWYLWAGRCPASTAATHVMKTEYRSTIHQRLYRNKGTNMKPKNVSCRTILKADTVSV